MMIISRMSLCLSEVVVSMSRAQSTSCRFPVIRRSILLLETPTFICARGASKKIRKGNIMVDPKHVVTYEEVLEVIHKPEKLIIDVRNPEEVNSTGKIPSSINIPLGAVQNVLSSMSNEEFRKQYNRSKPSASDELIFYCHSGKRSSEALDKALKMGYSKSKTYLGSWNDWSRKNR